MRQWLMCLAVLAALSMADEKAASAVSDPAPDSAVESRVAVVIPGAEDDFSRPLDDGSSVARPVGPRLAPAAPEAHGGNQHAPAPAGGTVRPGIDPANDRGAIVLKNSHDGVTEIGEEAKYTGAPGSGVYADGNHNTFKISGARFQDNGGAGVYVKGDKNVVNVLRGKLTGNACYDLNIQGKESVANVFGGEVGRIRVEGPSTVNLMGGSVTQKIVAVRGGIVNVYGSKLELTKERLTGVLADGSPIRLEVEKDADAKVLFPDPATAPRPAGRVGVATTEPGPETRRILHLKLAIAHLRAAGYEQQAADLGKELKDAPGESNPAAPLPKPPELANDLIGTWILVGKPGKVAEPPAAGRRLKFFTGKHWLTTQANPDTGEVIYHHGGTYVLNGDEYLESVEYANLNTKDLVSKTFKFKIKVEGDTLTQVGIGNPWTEVWKRATADPRPKHDGNVPGDWPTETKGDAGAPAPEWNPRGLPGLPPEPPELFEPPEPEVKPPAADDFRPADSSALKNTGDETALVDHVSGADVERILRRMGFEHKQVKEGVYTVQIEGMKATLVLGDSGRTVQLAAGFDVKPSAEKINEWNRGKRFSRAYLDRDGDAMIASDLNLEGGVTRRNIENFVRTFRISLGAFVRHLSPRQTEEANMGSELE